MESSILWECLKTIEARGKSRDEEWVLACLTAADILDDANRGAPSPISTGLRAIVGGSTFHAKSSIVDLWLCLACECEGRGPTLLSAITNLGIHIMRDVMESGTT